MDEDGEACLLTLPIVCCHATGEPHTQIDEERQGISVCVLRARVANYQCLVIDPSGSPR